MVLDGGRASVHRAGGSAKNRSTEAPDPGEEVWPAWEGGAYQSQSLRGRGLR